jgi:uncharacterized protein YdeI (YjbR/CyaY-like superfamily)
MRRRAARQETSMARSDSVAKTAPPSRAFSGPEAFRAWLERHGETEKELLLRLFKTQARERGLTYKQALDEALCYGWIDGVRRALDEDSFVQRFSPRKATSYWSAVNIRRYGQLEKEGRVRPPGREAFDRRSREAKGRYSFESRPRALAPSYMKKLRAQERAWRFFARQPPGYRRLMAFWVMSAKRAETRERRLEMLIAHCDREQRIPLLGGASARKA